jgi:hypothetical protein
VRDERYNPGGERYTPGGERYTVRDGWYTLRDERYTPSAGLYTLRGERYTGCGSYWSSAEAWQSGEPADQLIDGEPDKDETGQDPDGEQ